MNKFNKGIFCRAPYESVCIHATGKLVPCSAFQPDTFDKNINDNIFNFYNTPAYQEVRDSLEKGFYPKACISCKKKDVLKIDLNRHRVNAELQKTNVEPGKLKLLEISFSNTCNLACAMCSNRFSSKWNEHTKTAPQSILDLTEQKKVFTNTLTYKEIDEILENSKDLLKVVIKGGEPLYDKKTLYYLENLVEINPNVNIRIVTNLTVYNEKLLKKFPNLILSVSIDGLDDVYNYIRGFDFEIIKENFIKVSELNLKHVNINYTTTAYNMHQVSDTYLFFKNIYEEYNNLNKFSWTPLFARNTYFYINNISKNDYNKAKHRQASLINIPDYAVPSEKQLENFKLYTNYIDNIRGFSWSDIDKVY